jgi:hypothetical protein
MNNKHIFNKAADSEMLAMDMVAFLRKWGMWQDVQILTGGKCYTDDHGELVIRNEEHPEKYLAEICDYDCNGEPIWKDFSNPERLLDMTFEGPLSLLLRHHEYEVKIGDVSDDVKHIIVPETDECMDAVLELTDEYLEGKYSWDPVEYDSYEEWLELNQYCDMDEFLVEEKIINGKEKEFSSREEYDDFLMRIVCEREAKIYEYFEDDICANTDEYLYNDTFYDSGKIANRVLNEFADLLEKYGLWYELCFSWSLTTYRIE